MGDLTCRQRDEGVRNFGAWVCSETDTAEQVY